MGTQALRPWTDLAELHPDVEAGNLPRAVFAVDLGAVAGRFPGLAPVLRVDPVNGVAFDGVRAGGWRAPTACPQVLRDYSATETTNSLIENNLAWAAGDAEKPAFAFAYGTTEYQPLAKG